ncbi:M15 family metallopeptidase [Streptomyces specialis]|uniref:M15 family metallopeptidase n=1 Tax=Streptomyces specialis TaxID=498367 RepID=UPI00073E1939|nr:M15 family metallopeptidase [Streptomyces specialis]
MRRLPLPLVLAGLLGALCGPAAPGAAPGGDAAPPEFAALRDVAPGIGQEMRYASRRNFTGRPVDGYREPECLLTRDAASALRRAHRALARRDLGLLVYDCYRPRRAVADFLRWAAGPEDADTREEFHPRVPKDRLFDEGYLAARSGHSRGSTVDVTLVRRSGEPVDMGTPFDFFDPASAPDSREVDGAARRARGVLRSALEEEGFVPVPTEWWHFTLAAEPFPATYFDFPVSRDALRR